MIGIRSITYNATSAAADELRRITRCASLWDRRFEPHTQRINLPESCEPADPARVRSILGVCDISSVRWVNVPLNPKGGNVDELASSALELIGLSQRTFVNYIGVDDGVIADGAFAAYADLCRDVASLDRSGHDNFRLGLSFNIGHDCPFFPFTRSAGDELSFSIALELIQDVNETLRRTRRRDLEGMRAEVLEMLRPQIGRIEGIARDIEQATGIAFRGFDFSLAPVIGRGGSVITTLNALSVYNFGHTGTMFATSYITDILKQLAQEYPSVGFSGVMYSLLEDLELCSINNERGVSLEQMTALATMCGCGLDMVPVSGDITTAEVFGCCMDIAAISCKYDKPLGVRLLPIPGTTRSERATTSISGNADFIANTRVVPLDVNLLPQAGEGFGYLTY